MTVLAWFIWFGKALGVVFAMTFGLGAVAGFTLAAFCPAWWSERAVQSADRLIPQPAPDPEPPVEPESVRVERLLETVRQIRLQAWMDRMSYIALHEARYGEHGTH